MKANRIRKSSHRSAYPRWVSVVCLVLAPAVANAGFTGGPSVRVSPNSNVEFRWSADFVGTAKVEMFDNPDGTGAPISTITSAVPANDQTINQVVGGLIKADTRHYFKVTHSDGSRPDLTNGPAPFRHSSPVCRPSATCSSTPTSRAR
jgi:hypothetical protein